MGERSVSGDVARDYALRYPHTPSLQLARMLKRDHPRLFSGVQRARCQVQYYRGRLGVKHRVATARSGSRVAYAPMPEAEPVPFGVYDLEVHHPKVGRWLLLADAHIPYHNPEAIKIAVDWGKETGCDGALLLGDFCDCYSLSSWVRDPRRRRFPDELKAAGQVLDYIKDKLKPKAVVWKAGNHEYRLERYLMRCAAELFGMDQFSFKSFLGLDDRQVAFVDAMWPIQYRALTLLHGHEWKGGVSSPVNPARTAYLKMHDCTVVAHYHRSSEHTEPSMGSERTVTCWSVGCLCNLHPEYAAMNLWNLGFGALDTRKGWRVENKRIVNGEVA